MHAQNHRYSVHRGGNEIGEITASLNEQAETKTYEILSSVSFKVLWKRYHRRTSNLVVFQRGSLSTSNSGVYMNDELQDSTSLSKEPDYYRLFKYPDDHDLLNDTELDFSTAKLYFQEPVGIQRVYSERFLQYCELEAQEGHRYKLSLPDNKTNYYTYKDQQLVKVFVDRAWFNLEFRRK